MATDTSSATPTENEESGEEEEMDMGGMLKDMMARIEALESYMEDGDEEDEMMEDKESDDMSEIAKLKTKIAMMEVEKDIPNAQPAELSELASIKLLAPKQYKAIVKHRGKVDMGERGVTGAATAGAVTYARAQEMARKAGCAPGKETLTWIANNHPNALN